MVGRERKKCVLYDITFLGKSNIVWVSLMRNFIECQLTSNRLLHPNECAHRIFWFFAIKVSWGQSKIGHFQFFSQLLRPKTNFISLESIFVLEYQIGIKYFNHNNFSLIHVHQLFCIKKVPSFCWLPTKLLLKV